MFNFLYLIHKKKYFIFVGQLLHPTSTLNIKFNLKNKLKTFSLFAYTTYLIYTFFYDIFLPLLPSGVSFMEFQLIPMV